LVNILTPKESSIYQNPNAVKIYQEVEDGEGMPSDYYPSENEEQEPQKK
jgi:hypothetical protein